MKGRQLKFSQRLKFLGIVTGWWESRVVIKEGCHSIGFLYRAAVRRVEGIEVG